MTGIEKEPFNWRDVFEIQGYNDSYNVVPEIYQERVEILESVLDYEFADKDGDGKIDDKANRKLISGLLVKMEYEGEDKIGIRVREEENGSHKSEDMWESYINIDFEQIEKGVDVIDRKTGLISPMSLNAVVIHEIDHLYEKSDVKPMQKVLKKIGNQIGDLWQGAIEEQSSAIQILRRGNLDDEAEKEVTKKLDDARQKISELNEIEDGIKEKYPDIKNSYNHHNEEYESMLAERTVAKKHNEPFRETYRGVSVLRTENRPARVIYYTNDEQKYPYEPVQRVTESEIRLIYLEVKLDESLDENSKREFLEEIEGMHKHFTKKGLYDTSHEANKLMTKTLIEVSYKEEYADILKESDIEINLTEEQVEQIMQSIYKETDELGKWNYFEKEQGQDNSESHGFIDEAKGLLPNDIDIQYAENIERENSGSLSKNKVINNKVKENELYV